MQHARAGADCSRSDRLSLLFLRAAQTPAETKESNRVSRIWLIVGVIIAAIAFAVPAFAGVDWYASNVIYTPGATHGSAYDTCPYPGAIYGSTFVKETLSYGTTMFIDNTGYNWHKTVSGYGTINTTDSNYLSYNKKAASDDNSYNSYTGSASATYADGQCT